MKGRPISSRNIPIEDIEKIIKMIKNGESMKRIAVATNHSKSTIHRYKQLFDL